MAKIQVAKTLRWSLGMNALAGADEWCLHYDRRFRGEAQGGASSLVLVLVEE